MKKIKKGCRIHNPLNTKKNKIRKLERELKRNPKNLSAIKALEFWKTHDRKQK